MRRKHRKGQGLWWVSVWLVHVGLWFVYTNNGTLEETVAGLLAATGATAGVMVFSRQGRLQIAPALRDLLEAWRLPWYMVLGTWEVLQGLALQLGTRRGAPSALRGVCFTVGGGDPAARGRRALAVPYTTFTPNFIVLGAVRGQGLLLYHQILPGKVLPMTRNLGAQP